MISLLFRLAPYAIIVAAIAAAFWFFADHVRDQERIAVELKSTRLRLSQAQMALARAEEVARVHKAYLQQAEAEAELWEKLANDLQSMESRDAPLSDFLGTAAERLYSKRAASTSDNNAATNSSRSPASLPRLPRTNPAQ
ncbi:hypothetical protein PsAD13_01396 [Pseudovibrio sp. Ad13]|uniref:hypothetical protein n=1 Tax=Pseudovibrio sp. Ad13 TaxID=989396 RepID=UPI0007AEA990|nr:hypothetical protein [Pseudovibrio sp. Ad13]KZK84863.1 hypothetical protein PsAD13_01396 [Pseudovibrio sp. Ad13]